MWFRLAGYSVSRRGFARCRPRGVAMQQLSFEWNLTEPKIDPGLQSFVLRAQLLGGYIVSSKDCSDEELEQAKAEGRFYSSYGNREYVFRE